MIAESSFTFVKIALLAQLSSDCALDLAAKSRQAMASTILAGPHETAWLL
jgi:hypothetical protein